MYEGECIKNVELVKLYKHYIQLEKITARTLLLLMLLYWIYVTMNDSDEVWRWVHQKNVIIPLVQKLHSTGKYICSYLAVANDIWLNWCKNELEWWIMKLSASKIWNYSNCTKVSSNQNKQLLLPCCNHVFRLSQQEINERDEVWRWLHKKIGMSQILLKLHAIKNNFS